MNKTFKKNQEIRPKLLQMILNFRKHKNILKVHNTDFAREILYEDDVYYFKRISALYNSRVNKFVAVSDSDFASLSLEMFKIISIASPDDMMSILEDIDMILNSKVPNPTLSDLVAEKQIVTLLKSKYEN